MTDTAETKVRSVSASLEASDLAGAVATAGAAVKAKPASAPDRVLLAELLALRGEHERADTHLRLALDHAPSELLAISQMRWLLRGAEARRAWYETGSIPGFIGEPTQRQRECLRLAVLVRGGEQEAARDLRDELEAAPLARASVNGADPAPMRDASDLCQHGFEALTLDGRYLWIAPQHLVSLTLSPVRRPLDLLWRRADVVLADERDATFFLPAQYHAADATDAQRLGKETQWIEMAGGIVEGRGQRVLLVGEEACDFLTVADIKVAG